MCVCACVCKGGGIVGGEVAVALLVFHKISTQGGIIVRRSVLWLRAELTCALKSQTYGEQGGGVGRVSSLA